MRIAKARTPVVDRRRKQTRRPYRVIEVVIRSEHQNRVFGSWIARHVIARIVVEAGAFKRPHIAIAIRKQHRERYVVYYFAVEIDRGERKHRFDTIRRTERLI